MGGSSIDDVKFRRPVNAKRLHPLPRYSWVTGRAMRSHMFKCGDRLLLTAVWPPNTIAESVYLTWRPRRSAH